MPVSNGYYFSNYDGSPNIPRLCDPYTGEYEDMWRHTYRRDDKTCDTCDHVGDDVDDASYPAVLQETRRDCNYGYDEDEQRIVRAKRTATVIHLRVCKECYEHCQQIMKTSDHIALGVDWWDLNDSICESIKQLKCEKFDWKQTKPVKDAIKAATQIFVAKTGPFTQLPEDVIINMFPHLVKAYKERAAIQIQRIWKGYYQRLYNSHKNTQQVTYHKCADCGRMRLASDLCYENSCLDCPHECCIKRVCKDECHYLCPNCEGSNIIGWAWKNHLGTRTYEDCRWCLETFELPIMWHGPSQAEADAAADQDQNQL